MNFKSSVMKANELRIGNKLEKYLPPQISEWIEVDVSLEHIRQIKDNPDTHGLRPIPLTEKWLEKFGFDKHRIFGDCKYTLSKDFVFSVFKDDQDDYFYLIFQENVIEIKHVHQLQNLYFELTGEELKIQDNE